MRFIGLLFFLGLTSCAGPQTLKDFRTWTHDSSFSSRKEYVVKGLDLPSSETKLRAFMNKCFSGKQITSTTKMQSRGSTVGGFTSTSRYRPKIIHEKQRVTLYVQNDQTKSLGMPPGGWYEFLLEATPNKDGGVKIYSATMNLRLPASVLEDAESWLRGKGQFCFEPQ
jgi:hypothetical protein